VSKGNIIPPKTIRGNWQAIVTTEEFEQGVAILQRRNEKRIQRRRHDYLLRGLVFYEDANNHTLIRLTGSTPNAWRSGGGTVYYYQANQNSVSPIDRH
jgi:hypothetical protein